MAEANGRNAGGAGAADADPVSYLIAEFEEIVLRMAEEIDQLRERVEELEARLAPDQDEGEA